MDETVGSFGVLSGVKVVHAATALAGPFAAQFMAEHGADVLWIERAGTPENMRFYASGLVVEIDRRNQRNISLDIQHPEGREIFLELIRDAEILIESSKGGQFERWGMSDEVLWEANPRLVIVHVSGFGLTGQPDRVKRPSYDPIAQAYGCLLQLNGFSDRPPITAQPFLADYLTGLFACSAALAALTKARATGQGESVDVAQYEVLLRTGGSQVMEYLNKGKKPVREGARNLYYAGVGAYQCGDGEYVFLTVLGNAVLRSCLPLLGLSMGTDLFPDHALSAAQGSPAGRALDAAIDEFCSTRTALEVDELMNQAGVAASAVYTYEMAEQDQHYKDREVFLDWTGVSGKTVRGVNVFPKFTKNPGKIVRGAPTVGMDNEAVLEGLGYSEDRIRELYDSKVISQKGP